MKTLLRPLALLALIFALAPAAYAGWDDCSGFERHHDWGSKGRYCEIRELDLAALPRLVVDAGTNGGISVSGWDRDAIEVRARIEIWDHSESDATELAGAIDVRLDGERLGATGPRHEDWSVSYRIRAPRTIDLDLTAHNGGISLEEIVGRLRVETTNGGLGLVGLAGDVEARTMNGGVHVELAGDTWDGEGLDVETENGAINLEIPSDYSAELETGTVNGRVRIDFPVTVQGTLGENVRTTLGRGGPPVRVKTTNGAVRIVRR